MNKRHRNVHEGFGEGTVLKSSRSQLLNPMVENLSTVKVHVSSSCLSVILRNIFLCMYAGDSHKFNTRAVSFPRHYNHHCHHHHQRPHTAKLGKQETETKRNGRRNYREGERERKKQKKETDSWRTPAVRNRKDSRQARPDGSR